MLDYLFKYYTEYYPWFNIVSQLKFRIIAGFLSSFFLLLWIGPYFIKYFKILQIKQIIRDTGPVSHFKKCNVPTMGGILILMSIIISIFMWVNLSDPYVWLILFVIVSYGLVGFVDDYYKITRRNSKGLTIGWKYLWQSVIAIVIILIIFVIEKHDLSNHILNFSKEIKSKFSLWYVPLFYFIIVGMSNAVNLTDGLDGLVIMPVILVCFGMEITTQMISNVAFSQYLNTDFMYFVDELVIVCSVIIGACLGFLWFNAYPAKIFMGDTGSLSIGGTIGTIAILFHKKLLLLVIGGIFIIESVSVLLQIISFRLFKKRIFLMAPIHHHFELKGWKETHVVIRFWIISLILTFIGIEMLEI